MNVKLILLALLTLNSSLLTLSAAVPLRWTVETSRATPVQIEAYQGETLDLEASLLSYGKPLAANLNDCHLYWQTNGMGSVYWTAPAFATNSHLTATWSPTNDVGARVYTCFIGAPGSIYHAAFQLRLRPSPGAIPNTLPLPVPVIDFARVRVLNPPWPTNSVSVAEAERIAVDAVAPVVAEVATIPRITESNNHEGWAKCADYAVDADYATEASEADRVGGYDGLELQNMDERIYNNAADIAAHADKASVHVTAAEKRSWDAKLSAESDPVFVVWTNMARVTVGKSATASGTGVAIGQNTSAVNAGVAVGAGSKATGANGVVVGNSAQASGPYSAAFGPAAKTGSAAMMSVQLGNGTCNAANTLQFCGAPIGKVDAFSQSTFTIDSSVVVPQINDVAATANAALSAANDANTWSVATYNFMTGNTNAWFSGTNYVTTADGTTRTQFVWEDGMDAGTVPCSMSLWEIRDGQKVVWDQRDWTVWYWNFKAAQMSADIQGRIDAVSDEVGTNCMKRGWAKYTAVRGLDNPDPSTLWIDTPKVQLMAGHQWEKIVEVGGAGYWTISGNGINLSQQDAESTFLTIKDFEGNACLTFRKTSSYLVYCQCGTDIVSNYMDARNRVVFHLTTDVQPTAEFSTTLEDDSFVEQGTDGCPANYEWTGSAGNWDCHFILKPGITAKACFARFKVMREGENVVEHTVPIKINGGIVFEQNGQTLKCKPVAQGTSVGSTVNWVIAQ